MMSHCKIVGKHLGVTHHGNKKTISDNISKRDLGKFQANVTRSNMFKEAEK